MKLRHVLIAALAGHRAAQAITVEKISEPFRRRLLMWSIADDQGPREYEIRAKINQLLTCPHCLGFWLTGLGLIGLSLSTRRGFRWVRPFAYWWAAASIQTTLSAAWAAMESSALANESRHRLNEHELRERNLPGG